MRNTRGLRRFWARNNRGSGYCDCVPSFLFLLSQTSSISISVRALDELLLRCLRLLASNQVVKTLAGPVLENALSWISLPTQPNQPVQSPSHPQNRRRLQNLLQRSLVAGRKSFSHSIWTVMRGDLHRVAGKGGTKRITATRGGRRKRAQDRLRRVGHILTSLIHSQIILGRKMQHSLPSNRLLTSLASKSNIIIRLAHRG